MARVTGGEKKVHVLVNTATSVDEQVFALGARLSREKVKSICGLTVRPSGR